MNETEFKEGITAYYQVAWTIVIVFLWAHFFGWLDWTFLGITALLWVPIAGLVVLVALCLIVLGISILYNHLHWWYIGLKERIAMKRAGTEEEENNALANMELNEVKPQGIDESE